MIEMNSKIIILASLSTFGAMLMTGCSDSDLNDKAGSGTMTLATSVKMPFAASDSEEASEAESLMVWVSNSRGLIRRYNSLAEIPSSIQLRSGHYLVEGWAGDSVPASFTSRYFKGSTECDVVAGSNTRVDLTCRIANAVVSVSYSDDVDERLSDYSITVSNTEGSLVFEGRDMRLGYFMMGKGESTLTYTLSGTKVGGEAYSQTGEINNVKPATEYKLHVSPDEISTSEGAAFFRVTVDTSTIDEETEIEITLSPEIVGQDFVLADGVSAEAGEFSDVTVQAAAMSEIKSFSVGCLGWGSALGAESVDLFAISPDQVASLNAVGLSWNYKYEPDIDMSYCSVTFGAQLLNSLAGGEYPVEMSVTDSYGKTTAATLNVIVSGADAPVSAVSIDGTADVWATRATLRGSVLQADAAASAGFRYRMTGTDDWIDVKGSVDGSDFYAEISGLTPGASYEYIVTSDGYVGVMPRRFTTEEALLIPNGGFETWNISSSPYLLAESLSTRFWDTGNHGSATLNKNITTPESNLKHSGEYSAKLASQFVGFLSLGKFAAGNAFIGQYLNTDGADGVLGLGRPFTSRPSALSGFVRYEPATVDNSKISEMPKGAMDKGVIYVALVADEGLESYTVNGETTSWPFVIKTKESERRLFDKEDPRIIAYGEMIFESKTEGSGLVEFNIPLEYSRHDAKAAYLIMVCSASYYGDYFTGGPSVMYLDDFSFAY